MNNPLNTKVDEAIIWQAAAKGDIYTPEVQKAKRNLIIKGCVKGALAGLTVGLVGYVIGAVLQGLVEED